MYLIFLNFYDGLKKAYKYQNLQKKISGRLHKEFIDSLVSKQGEAGKDKNLFLTFKAVSKDIHYFYNS